MKNGTNLVAPCGLYCGECGRYKKGKCPGCRENAKASWCKLRTCAKENGYITCAQCTHYPSIDQCPNFNTVMAKFFSLFFKSDRRASLEFIRIHGEDSYAEEMQRQARMVFRRT